MFSYVMHGTSDRRCKELHDLLEKRGVSFWFSEKDVALGTSLLREIDKGLVKSRVEIVLVTPSDRSSRTVRDHGREPVESEFNLRS